MKPATKRAFALTLARQLSLSRTLTLSRRQELDPKLDPAINLYRTHNLDPYSVNARRLYQTLEKRHTAKLKNLLFQVIQTTKLNKQTSNYLHGLAATKIFNNLDTKLLTAKLKAL